MSENKLEFLKGLLKDELKNSLLELSKDDIVIQKILEKTNNVQDFVNSITAAIICIVIREKEFVSQFKKIIELNPEFKKVIEQGEVK